MAALATLVRESVLLCYSCIVSYAETLIPIGTRAQASGEDASTLILTRKDRLLIRDFSELTSWFQRVLVTLTLNLTL